MDNNQEIMWEREVETASIMISSYVQCEVLLGLTLIAGTVGSTSWRKYKRKYMTYLRYVPTHFTLWRVL